MATHRVVKHDEWLKARKKHLAKEKEFTRMRDQLSQERRDLPWELVEKQYTFQGEHGPQTLSDVFEGRGQLVVYHAMFHPDTAGPHTPWTADAPCFVCSFWMDNFNGITVHLNHRDITTAAISRAPYPKLAAYKKRMGWGFPWLSSFGSDFNLDYRVSFDEAEKVDYNYRLRPWGLTEAPGISVFLQGTSVAGVYGLIGGPLAEVRIFVPAVQAEEAARIFAELDFSGGLGEEEDAEGENSEE